jgi:riboflavin kinase/FMN adenylyltransferase
MPAATAIGNFDGVHLGHQRILSFLVHRARLDGLVSTVLTFSPHPDKVLGRRGFRLIQTEAQRLEKIRAFGVDAACFCPFDRGLAHESADDFIRSLVIGRLNTHIVVVGENFRFGRNREGDVARLQDLASRLGLTVYPIPSLILQGLTVSSSMIRELLIRGEVDQAGRFLGAPYEIEGRVIRGQNMGRALGFPTANLESSNEILPPGVFVTTALLRGEAHPSVTNVGARPTFSDSATHVETHILDVASDLYGETLVLRFHRRIREVIRFESVDSLRRQIRADMEFARRYLKQS